MKNSRLHSTELAGISDADLANIARLLRMATGIKLLPAQTSMLQSRLGRRLRHLGLNRFHDYVEFIQTPQGETELKAMISALTTNVTHFFRERHHFDYFCEKIAPDLLERARLGEAIRIWSAGCSSGPEPFTLAMCLSHMASDIDRLDIKILATDIDPEMINRARKGVFDTEMLGTISPEFQTRFFSIHQNSATITPPIQRLVQFKELNLNADWPMKRPFDVIFCRNVAIYFDTDSQLRLWHRLENALISGGWLFLGHSERIPPAHKTKLESAGITIYRAPFAHPPSARRR